MNHTGLKASTKLIGPDPNADGISDTEKIERSFAEGFKWLRLAADQNINSAQELLFKIYCDADGLGNEHLEEAKLWCEFYERPE